MKVLWFALMVSSLSAVIGCRPVKEESADLDYLEQKDYQCYAGHNPERINYIASLPAGFITGFSAQQLEVVKNRLAGIPDRDLDHLLARFSQNTFKGIRVERLGGGVAGVTYLSFERTSNGLRIPVALAIGIGTTSAGFALQHEVGHAVEGVAILAASKAGLDFNRIRQDIYNEVRSRGTIIRNYARSQPAESWAESYANYYCSEESNKFIADQLPTTYAYLLKILEPPAWVQAGVNAPAGGAVAGNDPANPQPPAVGPSVGAPAPQDPIPNEGSVTPSSDSSTRPRSGGSSSGSYADRSSDGGSSCPYSGGGYSSRGDSRERWRQWAGPESSWNGGFSGIDQYTGSRRSSSSQQWGDGSWRRGSWHSGRD
jgi:hypothetical protein